MKKIIKRERKTHYGHDFMNAIIPICGTNVNESITSFVNFVTCKRCLKSIKHLKGNL